MGKIPVIIDCDPGHDDALMLMLAFGSGGFDVKAVTVSAGNESQENTYRNTLRILALIGAGVPVFRGAEKPLFRELPTAGYVGLDNPLLPEIATLPPTLPAAEGIRRICEASDEQITLVPTGPLTNIATFIQTYPHLKSKIGRITLMGGGIFRGNITPLAEFNMYVDPEAAAIVFRSGIPISMCGIDVTQKALIFKKDIDLFRTFRNKAGAVAADFMDFLSRFDGQNQTEPATGTALHDPCAIAWLLNPGIFRTKACYVDVETAGELTSGTTVVDFYNVLQREPNVTVAFDINRQAYIDMLFNAIKNLP